MLNYSPQHFLSHVHSQLYWLTVILGAVGGLLVAFALKFTVRVFSGGEVGVVVSI